MPINSHLISTLLITLRNSLCALLSAIVLGASNLAYANYSQQTIDGITYGIFQAEPAQVSLHWRDGNDQAYRSLGKLKSALTAENRQVLMLMNAGIYSKDYTPAGLWVEHGKLIAPLNRNAGKGNFHIQPNGVFWLKNGRAHINTTAAYAKYAPKPDYAVQSGPMLVIDSKINSRFIKGLSSPYSRNAVCTTKDNKLLFILTEKRQDEWPSFYRLASALQDIGCHQALYLDGSISNWYIPGVSSTFHWPDFVGIIAVTTAK
ncbi:phosphodiester glycosidase family protein [Cardiobacteriaceae bacterium TAE3-ERU3]|nr:phosphodiester glycosidase family protein [Cardiobacteriaceae bacterium TAE3-ERU3]